MDGKEENRIIRKRKTKYLTGVIAIYMTAYLSMYVILALLNSVSEMHPYVNLFFMLAFLPAAWFITRKAADSAAFNRAVCRRN